MLVYLTTLPNGHSDGGHTVFPATASTNAGNAFKAITPPKGSYYRVDDNPTTSGRSSHESQTVGLTSKEAKANPNVLTAQRFADNACDDAAATEGDDHVIGGKGGKSLATRPVAGTAVLWYHEGLVDVVDYRGTAIDRALKVDPLAWHSGCVVRNTVKASEKDGAPPPPLERWAIQIFKEHYVGEGGDPRGDIKRYPPPKAFYETMRAHAAAAGEDEKGKEEKPKPPPRATVAVIVSALLKSLAPHDVVGYIGIVGTIVVAVGIWLFSRRLPTRRKPKFRSEAAQAVATAQAIARAQERKLGRPMPRPKVIDLYPDGTKAVGDPTPYLGPYKPKRS